MIVTGFGFLLRVKEDGDQLLEKLARQNALTGIDNRAVSSIRPTH